MAEIIRLHQKRQTCDEIAPAASAWALARALDHIALDIRAAGHRLAADLVWMAAEDLRETDTNGRGEVATETLEEPFEKTEGEIKNPL